VIPDADRILDAALALPGADAVEISVTRQWGGLTRFARNTIHQHVESDDTTLHVRVAVEGRVSAIDTNDATPEGARRAAEQALAAARLTPPDPTWPGLAGPASPPVDEEPADPEADRDMPVRRAAAVAALLGRLHAGQEGAGAVETTTSEVAFATTAGARHFAVSRRAAASTVVMQDGASGHAEDAAPSLDDLDAADLGEQAGATCAAAVGPGDAEPGDWQVVLLPSAVMTLLEYLAFTTFSAKMVAEGRSAFAERMGTQVASPLVSIADDAPAHRPMTLPFDGEGTPITRVDLIVEGVASGVVHDRATAAAAGVASTGHGLAGPNPFGPFAGSLVLAPGRSTLDDLVAGIDRGLLVTRFWYTRTVNPKKTLITGMTRDGTFRIEGGKVAAPVCNLRYNVSILDCLASCDGVGDTLRTSSDESSDSRAPALRLRSFQFTSSSDH